MPTPFDRPAAKPPSVDELPRYLRDAQPTPREIAEDGKAGEARRIAAVHALRALARDALKAGDTGQILGECIRYLSAVGLRIILSDDPAEEMRRWLGQHRRGRRPADNERRDILIAAAVAERAKAGTKFDDAFQQVGKEACLSTEAVREIYYKYRCSDDVLLAGITLAFFDAAEDETG